MDSRKASALDDHRTRRPGVLSGEHREIQRAPSGAEVDAHCPASALAAGRMFGRGNGPARAAGLQQAQQTYGNRAVQRTYGAVPVQREDAPPPSYDADAEWQRAQQVMAAENEYDADEWQRQQAVLEAWNKAGSEPSSMDQDPFGRLFPKGGGSTEPGTPGGLPSWWPGNEPAPNPLAPPTASDSGPGAVPVPIRVPQDEQGL